MKGLIIYATCYGSTEKYANWILEELPFEKKFFKKVTIEDLESVDVIVIGSWVLANKLFLAKWLSQYETVLSQKRLLFYSVSGAKPGDSSIKDVFSDSMSDELLSKSFTCQCGGKRLVKEMSLFHKFMMWIASTFIEKDSVKKQEMKQYSDHIDRSDIQPLINQLKSLT